MSQNKLSKRADGRYKVNYGSKQFYGKSKAEALKKRDEYVEHEMAGLNCDLSEMPFLEYGTRWLKAYRSACNPSQAKQYMNMVEFASEGLGRRPLRLITATDAQVLCNRLSCYSPSYMNKFMSLLRGIFKTAVAEGALLRNPMDLVKRPKTKKCEGHRALEPWERELVATTYPEHEFGLAAMVMLYAGLRRGEALYLDVDRDGDFEKMTITVNGAVSFANGNQPEVTDGKTDAARRTVPLVQPLADALRGHHGLLCSRQDGSLMSQSAFDRKFESYLSFLGIKLNGCQKGWYGRKKEHRALLEAGQELPPWKEVNIRCHDFRMDFCTRCYYAQIPLKTLQSWMGHADADMVISIYSKLTREQEESDAIKLAKHMEAGFENKATVCELPAQVS